MYNKINDKEVLNLLNKIDKKLDEQATQKNEEKKADNQLNPKQEEAEIINQLTQKQYELSNELSTGIETLKKLIQETEKYTSKAKGKYQK